MMIRSMQKFNKHWVWRSPLKQAATAQSQTHQTTQMPSAHLNRTKTTEALRQLQATYYLERGNFL